MDTGVKPTIATNDAIGRSAPCPEISWQLAAVAIAISIAAIAGCSSNSHKLSTAATPIPAVAAPSRRAPFPWEPQVVQILASSCFDCHSEERTASWYVKIAPSYWFSGSARKNLNFSVWEDYDAHRRSEEIAAIGRVISRGEMPPWDYTVFHPAAELTNEQKDLMSEWATRYTEALSAH